MHVCLYISAFQDPAYPAIFYHVQRLSTSPLIWSGRLFREPSGKVDDEDRALAEFLSHCASTTSWSMSASQVEDHLSMMLFGFLGARTSVKLETRNRRLQLKETLSDHDVLLKKVVKSVMTDYMQARRITRTHKENLEESMRPLLIRALAKIDRAFRNSNRSFDDLHRKSSDYQQQNESTHTEQKTNGRPNDLQEHDFAMYTGKQNYQIMEFQELFRLPFDEVLLEDFSCAIKTSNMIWHGRMYLSPNFVCFYSNILGKKNKLVLKGSDIAKAEQKSILMIPNALLVTMADETQHFFTSFGLGGSQHRDEAFQWIEQIRSTTSLDYAKSQRNKARIKEAARQKDKNTQTGSAVNIHNKNEWDKIYNEQEEEINHINPSPDTPSSKQVESQETAKPESSPEKPPRKISPRKARHPPATTPAKKSPPSTTADDSKTDTDEVELIKIHEDVFPVSITEFKKKLLDDECAYSLLDFQLALGNKDGKISSWSEGERKTREIEFTMKLQGFSIGPDSCRVYRTQRLQQIGDNFLLVSATSTPDVPFGDCFHVLEQWEIVAKGSKECAVTVSVGVKFLKMSWKLKMLKGTIESRSTEDSTSAILQWAAAAKHLFATGEKVSKVADLPPNPNVPTSRKSTSSVTTERRGSMNGLRSQSSPYFVGFDDARETVMRLLSILGISILLSMLFKRAASLEMVIVTLALGILSARNSARTSFCSTSSRCGCLHR